MPVKLPECVELLDECTARLVEEEEHTFCMKGATFGCKRPDKHGVPGIWVSMGCNGTFDLGSKYPRVVCGSLERGKPNVCRAGEKRRLKASDVEGGSGQMGASLGQAALLKDIIGAGMTESMRRLQAQFAIAPADGGGREFHDWLKAHDHPWAGSATLFESSEAIQEHVSASDYPVRDMELNRSSVLCGAVIFDTHPNSPKVEYTLRFNLTLGQDPSMQGLQRVMTMGQQIRTEGLVDSTKGKKPGAFDPTGVNWYTQSGFLAMQRTIDSYIAEEAAQAQELGQELTQLLQRDPFQRPPAAALASRPGTVKRLQLLLEEVGAFADKATRAEHFKEFQTLVQESTAALDLEPPEEQPQVSLKGSRRRRGSRG